MSMCIKSIGFGVESDRQDILELVNGFARSGEMLPLLASDIQPSAFLLIKQEQQILACGRLHMWSKRVGEVRSLAVAKKAQGKGLGAMILAELEQLAVGKGLSMLFSLTLKPAFFLRSGYLVTNKDAIPEKNPDCLTCAFRHNCQEIPVIKALSEV